MSEELPILAVCYDFDKTLTPDDMQAQDIFSLFQGCIYQTKNEKGSRDRVSPTGVLP